MTRYVVTVQRPYDRAPIVLEDTVFDNREDAERCAAQCAALPSDYDADYRPIGYPRVLLSTLTPIKAWANGQAESKERTSS